MFQQQQMAQQFYNQQPTQQQLSEHAVRLTRLEGRVTGACADQDGFESRLETQSTALTERMDAAGHHVQELVTEVRAGQKSFESKLETQSTAFAERIDAADRHVQELQAAHDGDVNHGQAMSGLKAQSETLTARIDAAEGTVQALQTAHDDCINHGQGTAESVGQQLTTLQSEVSGKFAAWERHLAEAVQQHIELKEAVGQVLVLPKAPEVASDLSEEVRKRTRWLARALQDADRAEEVPTMREGLARAEQAVKEAQTQGASAATDILQMQKLISTRLEALERQQDRGGEELHVERLQREVDSLKKRCDDHAERPSPATTGDSQKTNDEVRQLTKSDVLQTVQGEFAQPHSFLQGVVRDACRRHASTLRAELHSDIEEAVRASMHEQMPTQGHVPSPDAGYSPHRPTFRAGSAMSPHRNRMPEPTDTAGRRGQSYREPSGGAEPRDGGRNAAPGTYVKALMDLPVLTQGCLFTSQGAQVHKAGGTEVDEKALGVEDWADEAAAKLALWEVPESAQIALLQAKMCRKSEDLGGFRDPAAFRRAYPGIQNARDFLQALVHLCGQNPTIARDERHTALLACTQSQSEKIEAAHVRRWRLLLLQADPHHGYSFATCTSLFLQSLGTRGANSRLVMEDRYVEWGKRENETAEQDGAMHMATFLRHLVSYCVEDADLPSQGHKTHVGKGGAASVRMVQHEIRMMSRDELVTELRLVSSSGGCRAHDMYTEEIQAELRLVYSEICSEIQDHLGDEAPTADVMMNRMGGFFKSEPRTCPACGKAPHVVPEGSRRGTLPFRLCPRMVRNRQQQSTDRSSATGAGISDGGAAFDAYSTGADRQRSDAAKARNGSPRLVRRQPGAEAVRRDSLPEEELLGNGH
jgi:predicted  nucleic acid-binding Zn-ribbon protein